MRRAETDPAIWERHVAREAARYLKNRHDPEWRAKQQATTRRYIGSRRRFLDAVKTTCGCLDCGTREGRLDFDHRPGTDKLFVLGRADRAWPRLIAELEKCDVRCASCHTRRHLLSEPPRRKRQTLCVKGHALAMLSQGWACPTCQRERNRERQRVLRALRKAA